MKILNKVLSITISLLLLSSMVSAQTSVNHNTARSNSPSSVVETGNPFNLNLQLGASTAFGLPENSSFVIPQLGLDFNFGKFGFRATEQFFKMSPEFDINEYLEPFGTDITQTGVKEKSSNFLMGIIPYLNLPLKDNFLLQPALGLKYLIQNGATNYVTYKPDPSISLLEYPDGDARRSSFVIEPSVRAVFGKASKPVRFYVEASYALAVGSNEITYSYLDLTDILTPGGAIDPDLLGSAPKITGTQKIMPNSLWIGIGLELNITSSPTSVNHNSGRSNRSQKLLANIEKGPGGGDDIPDEQVNSTEIKPLVVVSKGAKKNKQGDAVTFSWEALNTDDCKPDMIEMFEIIEKPTSIKDDKGVVYNNTGAEKQLLKKYLKPKEGNIHTYKITKEQMPELFDPDKEFIWQVTLLDKDGNKPQCAWGGKNVVKNNYKSAYDCKIKLIIDSVKCNLNHSEVGFKFYDLYISIENPVNPSCDNPDAQINDNSLHIIPPTIIVNSNIGNQTISAGGLPYSPSSPILIKTPIGVPYTKLYVTPYVYTGQSSYAYDRKTFNFPTSCCDFCDDLKISIRPAVSNLTTTSHSGYDEVSFPVEITYSPWNVNRIVAEIVAFEHEVNSPNCKTCYTQNQGHGVFVDPSENLINGSLWQNAGNAVFSPIGTSFSRQAQWFNDVPGGLDLSSPITMKLNIGVPELNHLNCCQDKVRIAIRYSFITIENGECRVCEIVKTYCLVRTGRGYLLKLSCK